MPSASLREFLERWPWYRTLSAELRSLALNTVSERTAGPGDYIARSGEPSTHWYGLIRGFLQMYVGGADGAETTLYCMLEASRLRAPEMRLARALLMPAAPNGGSSQELSIPQHELALICGLSRQRVNVAISEFKRQGLVRSESHKSALIVDLPGLRSYVLSEG